MHFGQIPQSLWKSTHGGPTYNDIWENGSSPCNLSTEIWSLSTGDALTVLCSWRKHQNHLYMLHSIIRALAFASQICSTHSLSLLFNLSSKQQKRFSFLLAILLLLSHIYSCSCRHNIIRAGSLGNWTYFPLPYDSSLLYPLFAPSLTAFLFYMKRPNHSLNKSLATKHHTAPPWIKAGSYWD